MLEQGPLSHSPSVAFTASLDGDSNRKTSCSASDEERPSNLCTESSNMDSIGSELCADEHILGDQAAAVDNNLFCYQLNDASHPENNLDFLGNNLQDKESSDLLYYGWPEIENFEDLDRMFRSCDSTFGLEMNNDDEMSWLSSPHEIQGSDDALKSNLNFSGSHPCAVNGITKHKEVNGTHETGKLNDEIDQKQSPLSFNKGSPNLATNSSSNSMNGSGTVAYIERDPQIQSSINLPKQQKQSEGKQEESPLENDDSSINVNSLKQVEDSKHSLNFQCTFLGKNQQQKTAHQICLQTPISSINSNDSDPIKQALASPISPIIKSDDSSLSYVSLKDSSNGSNQMPMESSHGISFQNSIFPTDIKQTVHQHLSLGHLKRNMLTGLKADYEQKHNFESESQCEVNGGELGMSGEMYSSNIKKNSCTGSPLDEISVEANSFQQLQLVMEQLDIRMKLCIRDSLYRLARSAEQRHSGGGDNKGDSGTLISHETNQCPGFMDMETDTNPIDRSIAHLLFHRPSDSSASVALDAVPTKTNIMVQAPYNGPMMTEKLACQEESDFADNKATE